jgi:hypothetical protein
MGRARSTYGDKMNVYTILVAKTEGKIALGILRHRWDFNIKIDLSVMGWGGID